MNLNFLIIHNYIYILLHAQGEGYLFHLTSRGGIIFSKKWTEDQENEEI